jgi:hypothetical protein
LPIFISYSRVDKAFVDKLAGHLVQHNANVWIDSWELNVGDSLIQRIQQAIQDSSALVIVLSKASVASEWVKKELGAGLIRELDEKRVLVLPVLAEDCEIPMFLREKVYSDFRTDFDSGLKTLVESLAKVTNSDQGRLVSGRTNTDWAESWGVHGGTGLFRIEYVLVEAPLDQPFTVLTQILVTCNEAATKRYLKYKAVRLDWLGRMIITEAVAEFAEAHDIRLVLEDQFPRVTGYQLVDSRSELAYEIEIRCQRLGEDNGKDQLVNVKNYLVKVRDQARGRLRRLNAEETARLAEILSKQ